jgi:hypothetical protein
MESRPAIYRRYRCLEFALVPGGTTEISWLKRFNLAKTDPRHRFERRYSGVPPGHGPDVLPDPAINRRATVICPSGTKNHPKQPLSSRHSSLTWCADRKFFPTLPISFNSPDIGLSRTSLMVFATLDRTGICQPSGRSKRST